MNSIIDLLESGLNGAVMRQKAISNNIANANTPNYKRKDIDFRQVLDNRMKTGKGRSSLQLRTTDERHVNKNNSKINSCKIITENSSEYKNDKNNVDIDKEMAYMAKNNIYYNTLSQRLSGHFTILKNVIEKGGN